MSEASSEGEEMVGGEECRADRVSHCSSCLSSGFGNSGDVAAVSTIIVEEAVDPVLDIGICDEESEEREESVDAVEAFLSLRPLPIDLLLAPSCVYEGLLAFTILPSASLQSRLRVASMPRPSPPASSSFSLWRAICRSFE